MPDKPIRIQLSRRKGWRMPENTKKVDRSTQWGNPFVIGSARCSGSGETYLEEGVKDAETSVRFFAEMLEFQSRPFPLKDEIRAALRGKNLACWCQLDQPCHADVLLEIANG